MPDLPSKLLKNLGYCGGKGLKTLNHSKNDEIFIKRIEYGVIYLTMVLRLVSG
jgi:hypothetical protein